MIQQTVENLESMPFAQEDFAKLYQEYEKDTQQFIEGTVVKGVIVGITDKGVTVDIGAKSVGFVDLSEFKNDGEIKKGDVVDVFLDRLENRKGELIISRSNAVRYNNWHHLKQCLEDKTHIEGKIIGRVKGGYAVDVNTITCFLPKSQVDTMLLSDDSFLIGRTEKLQVLKVDDVRGNVVVSRRATVESQRNIEKDKALATVKIGDVLDGVVKNITDYGAFIDFGNFDGLLHLTDISWARIKHPSEALKVGQNVKVQVTKYDELNRRISLGMKQLQSNPWESVATKYQVGSTLKGKVTNVTNYGAFVELETGIEGLVHISEMSWIKSSVSPNKILMAGQEVDVMVLDVDQANHRISLGIKQCEQNPWQAFSEKHKVGSVIDGKVKDITEFGVFVELDHDIGGLVHISDISNEIISQEELGKRFKKDQPIKAALLGINNEKERISLGLKQLDNPNFQSGLANLKEGSIASSVVVGVKKDFLEVELDLGIKAIIKRSDLSMSKSEQRTDRFELGDRIEAKVVTFNNSTGKLVLSVRDMEVEEHESHLYSEEDSGVNIGNIAGDVLSSLKTSKKAE